MPVQVQLALVGPGLLLSASLRIVNLAQVFVAPAYACCRQIRQLNKPLDVFWRPVKIVPLALEQSLLEPCILIFEPWFCLVKSQQSLGWLLPVQGPSAKTVLVFASQKTDKCEDAKRYERTFTKHNPQKMGQAGTLTHSGIPLVWKPTSLVSDRGF